MIENSESGGTGPRNRERRTELLAAAIRQFARYGYKRTRIEDIATELGLSKGAVYFYAAGKEQLYHDAVEWALSEWCRSIDQAASAGKNAAGRLSLLARESFAYLESHPDLRSVIAMDGAIYSLDPLADRFASINEQARGLLERTLREGVASGEFRSSIDPAKASRFLYQVYIAFLIKAFELGGGDEAVDLYETGVDIAIKGLEARHDSIRGGKA